MAKKTTTLLIDDIDQSAATSTVNFSLDNVAYEIDLNDLHATQLRSDLEKWINAARRVGGRRRRGTGTYSPTGSTGLNSKVRAWAQERGIPVNDRGRVSQNLIKQYQNENS